MSEFWNDLEAAAKRVASTVSNEVTLAAREQKVREAYQALGRMYYHALQAGEAVESDELRRQAERITALLQEIDDLRSNR